MGILVQEDGVPEVLDTAYGFEACRDLYSESMEKRYLDTGFFADADIESDSVARGHKPWPDALKPVTDGDLCCRF